RGYLLPQGGGGGYIPRTAARAPDVEAARAKISSTVERQMLAAGRPAEEAKAAGALTAQRYIARAAWFNGALGSAEDLYRREGAEIRGVARARASAARTPPAAAAPAAPALPAGPLTRKDLAAFLA